MWIPETMDKDDPFRILDEARENERARLMAEMHQALAPFLQEGGSPLKLIEDPFHK